MPAGVHHADFLAVVHRADFAFERQIYQLGDRQGVHVGAQRDHRSRLAAAQHTNHARLPHVGRDLEAECAQMLLDERGGAHFLIRQLGMLVNVATPRHHFGHHRRHARFDLGGKRIDAFALCTSR